MIGAAVARTISALVTVVLVSVGLLAWHWRDDSALERALAADLKAGRSSAARMDAGTPAGALTQSRERAVTPFNTMTIGSGSLRAAET